MTIVMWFNEEDEGMTAVAGSTRSTTQHTLQPLMIPTHSDSCKVISRPEQTLQSQVLWTQKRVEVLKMFEIHGQALAPWIEEVCCVWLRFSFPLPEILKF